MSKNMSIFTSIANAICAIARLGSIWLKYKINSALPEKIEKLKNECEELERQIIETRNALSDCDSIGDAMRLDSRAERLYTLLERRRSELKYLSKSHTENKSE